MKDIKDIQKRVKPERTSADGFAGWVVLPDSGLSSLIVSWGGGWEHTSVAPKGKKVPTWRDMCWLKRLIWKEDEVVMQLHPAESNHVNIKNNCLHLWRPLNAEIPTPPILFV